MAGERVSARDARARRVEWIVAAVAGGLADQHSVRPGIDPVRYVGLRALDDLARSLTVTERTNEATDEQQQLHIDRAIAIVDAGAHDHCGVPELSQRFGDTPLAS